MVDDIGAFYMLVGAPFVAFTYHEIYEFRKKRYLHQDVRRFEKDYHLETYIMFVLSLIEEGKPSEYLALM